MEMSGQLHALIALPLVKELQVPIQKEAGGAPEPVNSVEMRKISFPARNRTLATQPITCHYTDCAFLALAYKNKFCN
jgi:hypothetical protein